MAEPDTGGTPESGAGARSAPLAAFGDLHPAERTLLEACLNGEWALPGKDLPTAPNASNRVRAEFIRFLLLCGPGEVRVHEEGVALRGAWIEGVLDVDYARIERRLSLVNCRLEAVKALHARATFINLSGCRIEGELVADGLRCEGYLFLRDGFHAAKRVRLLGAVIGADLDCSSGRFGNSDNEALSCSRISVAGRVNLASDPEQETPFEALGMVNFNGATIDGDLDCTGAVLGAPEGTALSCVRAEVGGRLMLEAVVRRGGAIDLTLTQAGFLCDGPELWADGKGALRLDGFTYARFAGRAPTDAKSRIDWLKGQQPQDLGADFRPQPWHQAISVLRTMGYPEEARDLAVALQDQLRAAGRVLPGTRLLHAFYGWATGYGYRPMRLLGSALLVWLFCAAAYWDAADPRRSPTGTYLIAPSAADAPKPDYATFVPLVYSADVLLPVVDFGYQDAWQPVVPPGDRWSWGQALRFLYWAEIAFGWVASLLLAGVLGALLRKD